LSGRGNLNLSLILGSVILVKVENPAFIGTGIQSLFYFPPPFAKGEYKGVLVIFPSLSPQGIKILLIKATSGG
jgi:hypothetical protein